MRALVHLIAILGLAAVAIAFGRWLRAPEPGGPLIVLCTAALLCGLALRRLYRPGGLGRAPVVTDLRRLPGIGPVGAERIVDEREANGPYRSVGDLVRVAGFGPSRIRGLGSRVRAG